MSGARQIQELLHSKIPITGAMGVKVEDYDGRRLILSAPLDANVNHLGTAFGGSLNALAVLSGYGLLWLELQDTECHIVIRDSSISYERPVRGEIRASCALPKAEELAEFKLTFQQKGKARIALAATIEDQGVTAVRFRGKFVALRQRRPCDGADVPFGWCSISCLHTGGSCGHSAPNSPCRGRTDSDSDAAEITMSGPCFSRSACPTGDTRSSVASPEIPANNLDRSCPGGVRALPLLRLTLIFATQPFTGRVIAALYRSSDWMSLSGRAYVGAGLGAGLGVTDIDGSQPVSHRATRGGPPELHSSLLD